MATINIIDPCMEGYLGHHADINLRLARELAGRGIKVKVYANKKFISNDPDIDIKPVFTYSGYSFLSKLQDQMSSNTPVPVYEGMAMVFERELQSVNAADLTVMPTVFAYQIRALASAKLKTGMIFAGLHVHPEFQNPQGGVFWKMALIKARPILSKMRLGIFEPELLLEYEALLPEGGGDIAEFPIPHEGSDLGTLRNSLTTVGVLGHQRHSKGLQSIPKTIKSCLDLGFNVTLQDSGGKLGSVLTETPRLKILGHVKSMGDLVRGCDVTLLDYSPEMYRYSGSGIAWESVASGVPVLAPKGTTISRLLREYDSGATFCISDGESKLRVLQEMRNNYKWYLERAQAAQIKYREKHGTKRFADLIVKGL